MNDLLQRYDINTLESDGFFNGKLGIVYFYFILYKHTNEEKYLDNIENTLSLVFNNIENQKSDILFNSSLSDGLCGLAYVINQLVNENLIDVEYKSEFEGINEFLFNEFFTLFDKRNFDYIKGPFGILFYFNSLGDKKYVEQIVTYIIDKTNINNECLPFYNNTDYIEGVHIGYAHGICAIVKVLNDTNDIRCDPLIFRILDQLRLIVESRNEKIEGTLYYLPRSVHGFKNYNYRAVLAWSNSDLNFSTLIFSLHKKFQTNENLTIANKIALGTKNRLSKEQTRVWDHRFFFGSSGVLQMYNYLYQKTQKEEYKLSAQKWYNKTKFFLDQNTVSNHKLDLINNLPATILALIDFEDPKETGWAKPFLL